MPTIIDYITSSLVAAGFTREYDRDCAPKRITESEDFLSDEADTEICFTGRRGRYLVQLRMNCLTFAEEDPPTPAEEEELGIGPGSEMSVGFSIGALRLNSDGEARELFKHVLNPQSVQACITAIIAAEKEQ